MTKKSDLPTEVPWETFCDLYIDALARDEEKLAKLPDRYEPGEGVLIPILERRGPLFGADDPHDDE